MMDEESTWVGLIGWMENKELEDGAKDGIQVFLFLSERRLVLHVRLLRIVEESLPLVLFLL